MEDNDCKGWEKLLIGYPWFNCTSCYPLTAYSEYMPPPMVGRKPLGKVDHGLFTESDPYGWQITEAEEEYELRPGIEHAGKQIMNGLMKLGKGQPEHYLHGHGGQNLKGNPYWPPELAAHAGTLNHERYVLLLPLMLSRTQDDKGRVTWTLFGNSIHGPEEAFWKSFYTLPETEIPAGESIAFFIRLISDAYDENLSDEASLHNAGFRILPSDKDSTLPRWTQSYLIDDTSSFDGVKYLLTFRPFAFLPAAVRERYLAGAISLLPFPGSLVFWGMPTYNGLKKELPLAAQIPLLRLVARNRGVGGMRVPQSGWIHDPRPDTVIHEVNNDLVHDSFQRTHRWQRVHRYQDELNEIGHKVKLVKALFSTEPDAMGLYDKPLARNSHLWDHTFTLLLDGPKATRAKIREVEKTILKGGLFGYRFFYPPMRVGTHDVYWHRPLVAYVSAKSGNVEFQSSLMGYLAAYHTDDAVMTHPVYMWPRLMQREPYLSALRDFNTGIDRYAHQTSMNILSLMECWQMQEKRPLARSYARSLLNISKDKTLDQWLDELSKNGKTPESGRQMCEAIEKMIEPQHPNELPEAITYSETTNRHFEEDWWNDIKFLAHGRFIHKDNADIMQDETTLSQVHHKNRDLDSLGDYFMERHRKAIAEAGMEGIALCGELPFQWKTDFEFSSYGGWLLNQKGNTHERNLLVVIPGKNRRQTVVLGDHYDTAYMEDIYEKARGGTGARLSANGADDNYSASATLLQAAPIFLRLSKEGKLERDVWLIHLTGEEFPADCMGARNFCQALVEKNLRLQLDHDRSEDLSDREIVGAYIMDMIGHNRENDRDVFQISPGKSAASLYLAWQAHMANLTWNAGTHQWNHAADRRHRGRGKRMSDTQQIPETARHLPLDGEVRTRYNPHSSIFNTDGQIFSDVGVPVVLFMENYDINRSGYHDTKDTLENIDLDYGAAFAAIAIETVARVACSPALSF
jgi:hypothetical protein